MEGKWVFDKDLDLVASEISKFECSEIELVIKPLRIQSNSILFGCYIPTIPRPTSIISGKILVKRLVDNQTELRAIDFQDWAVPFIEELINFLSVKLYNSLY